MTEIEELKAQLAAMTQALDLACEQLAASKAEFLEATAARERLREALARYGQHERGCPVIFTPELCNCGLTEVLAEPGAS